MKFVVRPIDNAKVDALITHYRTMGGNVPIQRRSAAGIFCGPSATMKPSGSCSIRTQRATKEYLPNSSVYRRQQHRLSQHLR